jgi:hypothetical protein
MVFFDMCPAGESVVTFKISILSLLRYPLHVKYRLLAINILFDS